MLESIDKILDFLGKYAWAVVVLAAFVLFVPDETSKQIGLIEIKSAYKGYWWLGLVLSGAIWIKSVFTYFDKRLFESMLTHRALKKKKEADEKVTMENLELRIKSLDREESMWIMYCLFYNVQTITAYATSSTANSLLNKRIVVRGSGSMLDLPFHINDTVWKYLLENKDHFLPKDMDEKLLQQHLDDFRRTLHML